MTESAVPNIIVIGASSGGLEALCVVVSGLPVDLAAAIFVVLHIGNHPSRLPEILTKAGALPAIHPRSGALVVHGNIYVAPQDRHLLIEPGRILLSPRCVVLSLFIKRAAAGRACN